MRVLFTPMALLPDGWFENVRVAIDEDGRITQVETGVSAQAGDELMCSRVLLPALANLHSHSFQRAMAGLTETRASEDESFWSWRALMHRFLERLNLDQIEAIASLVFVEMLESGYASVGEFHYLHHEAGGRGYDDPAEISLRIVAAVSETGIGLTHLPVLYAQGNADGGPLVGGQLRFGNSIDSFTELFQSAANAVATLPADCAIGVAPHSLRTVSRQMLADVAKMNDGPIHIHIAEQTPEVEEIKNAYGARPVEWLLANADVDTRWTAIHATHMTLEETLGLARSGAVAGLCPITEANLGDGIFDGARFCEAGGAFGIGSDSNIRIGLAEELRTLEYSQRYRDKARVVLCAVGASNGRTLYDQALKGGHQALARNAGAIETGRWADLVALDTNALALSNLSGDALLDAWLFAGDDRVVTDVWSAGRHVVEGGRHIKRSAIEERYRSSIKTLKESL